jgi:phospholipid/cholesterol/gamma-HCH transport system permease protein
MVTDSSASEEVICGPAGVIEGTHPGLVLIDMSSIAPDASRSIAGRAEAAGIAMLDAPVGGSVAVAASGSLGIGSDQYLRHTFDAVDLDDFYTGLIKAGVFGILISSLACYLGLGVTGGAQGVGAATTRTVVYTIVALIVVDLMFTAAFYAMGL